MACDTTWDAVMNKIRGMANRDTPVYAIDISSDGNDRWQCPCCKEWWYGKKHYCSDCGQKIRYS